MSIALRKVYFNPRMWIMLAMGFSSGLPLMLTLSTLQAWFTEAGVNIVVIGTLSLIGLPYVFKFLWAPIMDRFRLPWGGRRKGWIFAMQLALCVTLFWIAWLDPKTQPLLIGIVALLIAFFSASQDISVDAYRTDVLETDERGLGSAYFVFAYRIAMLVAGGVALVLADHFGWRFTYETMAVVMGLLSIVTWFAPSVEEVKTPANLVTTAVDSFRDLWQRESIGIILLFVVFYKLGDALSLSLLTTFLLHGVGFSLTELGIVVKTVGLIGVLLGAFVGGTLMVNLGLFRSLLIFGFAQAVSTLSFMLLAMVGKSFVVMVVSVALENFCSGMSTVAFMAFLMSLCHVRYTATQYASLSALASVGRVFLGPVAGVMVQHLGWVTFYAWSFAMSFPGLMLLFMLRSRVSFNAKMAEC
jgi:PAT family beta-lactamase induction signal transducer AmpG